MMSSHCHGPEPPFPLALPSAFSLFSNTSSASFLFGPALDL